MASASVKTTKTTSSNPESEVWLEQYKAAMKLFCQQKFERARPLLEKVAAGPEPRIADRARMHLQICAQRLDEVAPVLRGATDYYNAGVVEMNQSHFDTALEYLQKAAKLAPKDGYVAYALAVLHAQQHQTEPAVNYMEQAIRLEPRTRWLARTDRDLQGISDDPRFTELLYPEPE